MALPYPTDPSTPSLPNPYFQDNGFVRGDQQRDNNAQIWADMLNLDGRVVTNAADIDALEAAIAAFGIASGSYVPALTSTGGGVSKATTPDVDIAYWKTFLGYMLIQYTYIHTNNSGAANGTGTYLWGMPSGYAIDFSRISAVNADNASGQARAVLGSGAAYNSTPKQGIVQAFDDYAGGKLTLMIDNSNGGYVSFISSTVCTADNSPWHISFSAIVPYVEV